MKRRGKAKSRLLGPLEIEIMKVVWELGDVAVSDVLERLRATRSLHHNTVMTTMKRLAEKGILEQYRRDGRTNGYRPRVSRDEMRETYMNVVVDHLFGGSVAATVAGFLGMDKVPRATQRELKKLVEELEKEEN